MTPKLCCCIILTAVHQPGIERNEIGFWVPTSALEERADSGGAAAAGFQSKTLGLNTTTILLVYVMSITGYSYRYHGYLYFPFDPVSVRLTSPSLLPITSDTVMFE
jgi:hypothetical protein